MRRIVVPLALVAGCGNSASMPDAPPPPDAPAIDAATMVTARSFLFDVRNDATRAPAIEQRDFTSVTATVMQPDHTWSPIAVAADGTFAFPIPDGGAYRLQLAFDGGFASELQLEYPHLELGARFGARYERARPTPGTTLAVTLANAPASGYTFIEPTGVWTNLGRPPASPNSSFSIDWTQAPGLLDAGAYDRAYAVIYDNIAAGAYQGVVSSCSADVTMTAGTATPMSCTLAPAPLDHCAYLKVHFASEYARLVASSPIAYTNLSYAWNIFAAPAASLGPTGILQIASAGFTAASPMDLVRPQTMYAVPFPNHTPLLTMTMQRYRTVFAPGTTIGQNLSSLTQNFVAMAPDCTTFSEVGGTVAIPSVPTLAGSLLGADNVFVTLDRTRDVDLTWDIVANGRVDYWQIDLYALTAVGTVTNLALQHRWIVKDVHVAVDPSLLVVGSRYVIVVTALEGFADTGGGDFRTLATPSTPYATATQPSGIFQVAN